MEIYSELVFVAVIVTMFVVAYVWGKPSRKPNGVNELIGGIPGHIDRTIKPPLILIYEDFQIYDSIEYLLTSIEEWQFDEELAIDANGQVITFRLEDGRHFYSYSVINRQLLNAVLESMCLNHGLTPEEIENLDHTQMYQILRKPLEREK